MSTNRELTASFNAAADSGLKPAATTPKTPLLFATTQQNNSVSNQTGLVSVNTLPHDKDYVDVFSQSEEDDDANRSDAALIFAHRTLRFQILSATNSIRMNGPLMTPPPIKPKGETTGRDQTAQVPLTQPK